MSIWARVGGIEIKDLKAFEMACREMGLEFCLSKQGIGLSPSGSDIVAYFEERTTGRRGFGLLARNQSADGTYQMEMDTDQHYNPLIARADLLGRTYAEITLRSQVEGMGGSILERVESEDGGLLLRVMVA